MLRKCWKSEVSFYHHSNPVSWKTWTLPWILQELKKYAQILTCSCGQPGGQAIWVLNERSYCSDCGNFCPLWLAILKSLNELVLENLLTAIQFAMSDSELQYIGPLSLKQTRTYTLENKFMWFFKVIFWCFVPDIDQVCQKLFWDWEKLNFLNKLIS